MSSSVKLQRTPTEGELCHERLADRFAACLSDYDTQRRIEVLIDDFLQSESLPGKSVIDVGCGLGFFSKRLTDHGADVTACDIGPSLVEKARHLAGCHGQVADVMRLADEFGENVFDGLVSSECIEHVPDPALAIEQMVRVVKPGGFLSMSTPNIIWSPVVKGATALRLRPFDGHENFSSWRSLRSALESAGANVSREFGLHLFPFQIPLHSLSRLCDRRLQRLRGLMINLCVLAQKA